MIIAMIDDSPVDLALYKRILRPLRGVEFVTFESSAVALAWSTVNDPDLLVVDYAMPDPDGIEVISRFRKLPDKRLTPIVMVTAAHQLDIRSRALELGASDFLTKPTDGTAFVSRVRGLLALRAEQKNLEKRALDLRADVRRTVDVEAARERGAIERLALAIDFRTSDGARHPKRVGAYAGLIAATLGLDETLAERYVLAAPLHDIGHVSTPDRILLGPYGLTPEETSIVRRHTIVGRDMLSGSDLPALQLAAEIAHTHHERFDGGGYPNGLHATEIPLAGRICALADVFDALMSDRPYRRAWSLERALEHIGSERGAHFDPDVVMAFLAVLPQVLAIGESLADNAA